ncbi:tRNA lysidine(34) synthetase TilS [Stenoxybacter acetivorans]|uniref:tRNA lysidine(34) synthetase TilS n=1 Tax=Stenoxybacter acetivorans TaxID=422441 RepID=UPI000559C112|nr:tRNA lysidine(34) synthetase TilS [Stenoxybacter acetivorans]
MGNTKKNNSSRDLADQIKQQWSAFLADHSVLTVGLSGGLDSVVLLHILCRLRDEIPFQLQAVHIHHGLSFYADDWQLFCSQICRQWQIPFHAERVQVSAKGLGIEAAARVARYAVYAQTNADVVALAHHRDDQVETFMLAALRGGGLRALSAMPALRPLSEKIMLWRPLLPFSRQQLTDYSQTHQLPYIDDDSNRDTTLLRNWLRLQGLPAWRARVPNLDRHIEAAAALLQDELAVLNEIRDADWAQLSQNGCLNITEWRQLSAARQHQQLVYFAQKHVLGTPTAASVYAFARQLRSGSHTAEWSLPQGKAVLYGNQLWFQQKGAAQQWHWLAELPKSVQLNHTPHSFLSWQQQPFGLPEKYCSGVLRTAQPNDSLRFQYGRKSVKKILQEYKIPPFLRRVWPILVNEHNECIAVCNLFTAANVSAKNGFLPVITDLPLPIKSK